MQYQDFDDDPLAPARGCFINGPLFALVAWAVIIGGGYLLWRWL